MSTPREFWILRNSDADTISSCEIDSDEAVHVIEKTPEVVRKLECFDELVKALEFYGDKKKWSSSFYDLGNLETPAGDISIEDLGEPDELKVRHGGKLARETLKKAKGE